MMENIRWKTMVAMVQLLLLIAITSSSPAKHEQQATVRHRRSMERAYNLQNDTRLPSTIIPLHYKLQFSPNLEAATFQGHVQITFSCNAETDTVTLHADNELVITQMQLDVVDSTNLKSVVITGKSRDADKEWLVISLAEELHIGVHYQLTLNFNGKLQTEQQMGFVRSSYRSSTTNETRWFAGTNTPSNKARSVFPCFDEPMFKTPFEVSVARQEGYNTVANTPLRASEIHPEDATLVWDHFIATPPISTFSVGVFVSDFVSVTSSEGPNNNVTLQVFGRPGTEVELRAGAETARKLLTILEDYLGMPYPFRKLDIIASTIRIDYAGLLNYLEKDLTRKDTYYLGPMLSRQWFSHMTSPAWWNATVEATSLYTFAALASGVVYPRWGMEQNWPLVYYLNENRSVWSEYTTKAGKEVWTLQMLNYTLSEDTFKRGLLNFLEDRKFKSYTPEDLWTALDSTASNKGTDLTVSEIVTPWLEYNRFPVIKITRNYEARTATIEQHAFIREVHHNIPSKYNYTWVIPIMYITAANPDISSLRPVTWMNEKEITVADLPEADQFIVANPNGIGMFLVNYDQSNWAMIAQYLAEDPSRVSAGVRNHLLHDAWNLGYAGELDFNSVLNMTVFLPKETTPSVWKNFITMQEHLGMTHLDGTQAGKKFDEYFVMLMTNYLESLPESSIEPYGETNSILRSARDKLSKLSNATYEERAGTYKQWIENMDPSEDISRENSNVLCAIAKWGSNEESELCINKLLNFASTANPSWRQSFISQIAECLQQDAHFQRLLKAMFLETEELFTDTDRELAINTMCVTSKGAKNLLTFLNDNWEAVKHSLEKKPELWVLVLRDATEYLKNQEELDKLVELYEARKEELGDAKKILEKSMAAIKLEIEWGNHNNPVIEAWLDH